MICNYENITDYCLNKFTYQYAAVPTATSGDMITSVIRTDKDSGEVLIISPDSDLYVLPCDSSDLVEVISVWECYQIFVNHSKLVVKNDTDITKDQKNQEITNNYDTNLQDNIIIPLSNFNTIMLDSTTENQIHLGNIFCLANILYNENVNNKMPYILDVNNVAYYFNYNDLKTLLIYYFYKVTKNKNIADDLLYNLSNIIINEDDIKTQYFCNTKVPKNIIKSNISIDLSTYKNLVSVSLPPEICDPPCDPNNCESCVNGNCESLCAEGQCCYNGSCIDCLSCELNSDCNVCESNYVTRFDYTHDNCNNGTGCVDCEVLASICGDVGGTYYEAMTLYGKVCNCQDTPSFATSLNNCDHLMTTEKDYAGIGYDFESGIGYCCDNQCQIDPC